MGVHGLWQLLGSTGKPVPLDSLEGKVLAVDVSVWLHQLSKGMRDSSGNPLPNAHLHGLFTRICKLLYYRIKPVFVFDGGVPILKKQTLASRRNKREDAERTSSMMQQKILINLIRSQALKEACGLDKLPDLPPPPKSSTKGNKEALYQLPPLPEVSKSYLSQKSANDETDVERWELQQMVEEEYEHVSKIDVESKDFQSLPAEVQHEVITDMRLRRKNYNLARMVDLPDDSKDFSNYQMAKLVKHNKLNTRLDEIRKDLNDRQTRSLTKSYGKRFEDADDIYSQRVVSDDSSHYILAKRNLKRRKEEEEERKLAETKEETVTHELEVISEADELLFDSDEDSCKEVDVMEESRLIFEEISGQSDEFGGGGAKRTGNLQKESTSSEAGNDAVKMSKPRKAPDILDEKNNENKPRFRAVIEVESDSGSETSEDSVAIVGAEDNDVVVIDDGTVDPELQLAIEQSLREQRKAEKKKDLNDDMSGVTTACKTTESNRRPTKLLDIQGVPVVTSDRKGDLHRKKLRQDASENNSAIKQFEAGRGQERKLTEESKTIHVKKTDTINEGIARVSNETETPGKTKGKAGIFKRRISCLSNESTDGEEASRKVQRLESTDSVIAIDSGDSSESEDDFIEVKIDLTEVKEDDLFPASMFEHDRGPVAVNIVEDSVTVDKAESMDASDIEETKEERSIVSEKETVDMGVEHSKEERSDKSIDADNIKETDSRNNSHMEVSETETVEKNIEEFVGDDSAVEETERQVTMETEAEVATQEPPELTDTVKASSKRPASPAITSLVRQFESLTEQHVKGLRDNLAKETRQLRLEQGKQERLAVSITDQMHSEAQELLQLFGIPYIVSPTEAEAQCAQLELIKLTNGTITDDSDIWLFGGKCVFKNFFNQQKHVECFKDVTISAQLGLNRDTLINIALLCGSDYTEGIRGVGPVTAMEILAKFPGQGIEGLARFRTWWEEAQTAIKVPLKQSKLLAKLRELEIHSGFPNTQVVEAYLKPTVDDSNEKFSWSLPNLQDLRQFAGSKLKWTREKTDEVLLPVLKRMNENRTQRSISSYFQPEVYMNPVPVKSKRLQKVVEKFINPGDEENSETEEKDTKKKTRSKVQLGQGDSDEPKGSKKTRSKAVKAKNDTEGQTDVIDKGDSDKGMSKRNTRASKKKDTDSEVIENTDNKTRTIVMEETDRAKPRGRGRGRGRGRYQESNRSKTEVIESEIIDLESSSSEDSDSDSTSSDSEYDYEGIGEGGDENEMPVIETGLDIGEILNLKMGCKIDEIASEKELKQTRKVYENLVNVNEILHLESGAYNYESGEENQDIDDIIVDDRTGKANKDVSDVNTNKEEQIDSENFAGEGGFIREEEDAEDLSEAKGVSFKADVCSLEYKESIADESCKQGARRTRSSRTNNKRDKSEVFKTLVQEDPKKQESETDVIQTKSEGNSDSKLLNMPSKTEEIIDAKSVKPIATATVKPIRSTETKGRTKKPVKQETSVYASDPIKPFVSGLPWAEKGRGRKRGTAGKGQSKAKIHNVTPMEKFMKKTKPKESIGKKNIGSVNLSESDSD